MEKAPLIINGRLGIPEELERMLPWWLRYKNSLFTTPLSVLAILAMFYGFPILSAALLFASLVIIVGAFWLVKRRLTQSGHWVRGTWHAEVLPYVYKLRAVLGALFAIAFWSGYLVLEVHVQSKILTILTVTSLALIPPIYIWLSVVQGFVGSDAGNIDFRTKNPARFLFGLGTYAIGMSIFIAVLIYIVLTTSRDIPS